MQRKSTLQQFALSLFIVFYKSRAVLRGGGQGFPHTTMNVAPGYFQRKTEEKWNQKKPLAD